MAKKQDDRTVAKQVREFLNQHTPLIPISGAGVTLEVLQKERLKICPSKGNIIRIQISNRFIYR